MDKSPNDFKFLIVVVILITAIANLIVPVVDNFNEVIKTLNRLNITFR